MATDATAAPTSLGIPKINPDADAPSGVAMNEQADAIDSLLVARLTQVQAPGHEIGYDQITANVTVASSTESAGTTVIACAAHTFDGGIVIAEFYAPMFTITGDINAFLNVCLFEGATEIGRMSGWNNTTAGVQLGTPGSGKLRFTPTAGDHTYTVTAFATAGAGTAVLAGLGGTAAVLPAFIRFTKV